MLEVVSLFSGCGGSDRGLIDAGCQIVMANDISPYAREVYEKNLPETEFVLGDVRNISLFPPADILIGCYPCQGYSQGGARDASRKVNTLYREFDRALRQIRPKAFIVENVPGMARSNNKHLLQSQIIRYRLAGYRVRYEILNAADYGLPQERRRLFIVGINSRCDVKYEFPKPTHGPSLVPFNTQAQCLPTDNLWPAGEFYDHGFHWYYLSRDRYRNWDSPSKTVLANARHMPLHPMSPPMKRLGPDEWIFDGNAADARRLSYKEAAALQDMVDWRFPDTTSLMNKYKVIGNAVPPMIFRQVFDALPEELFA